MSRGRTRAHMVLLGLRRKEVTREMVDGETPDEMKGLHVDEKIVYE